MENTLQSESILQDPAVQYVSDQQGTLQSVLVPIDLWRRLLALHEVALSLPETEERPTQSAASVTLYGAFPELASLEFGEQLEEPNQVWSESLGKQLRTIQGGA